MVHIIDDNEYMREILTKLIALFGYDATAFSCPVEYLDYVKSPDYQRPFVIITDVRMPKMTGFEMMAAIREYYPDQEFVVISGYSEERNASEMKIYQYISKPFRPEEIKRVVTALAKSH